MLEIHNSFNVFVQTLNVNEVCQVRVNSRNLALSNHGKIILKVHVPNKREMWLPCFEKIWPLNGMKMSWYSACLLLLFLFRANCRKDTWMSTTSVTVMAVFFEKAFWKLRDHSYVQSPFSANTRHIYSILKDTLQLFVLRT